MSTCFKVVFINTDTSNLHWHVLEGVVGGDNQDKMLWCDVMFVDIMQVVLSNCHLKCISAY